MAPEWGDEIHFIRFALINSELFFLATHSSSDFWNIAIMAHHEEIVICIFLDYKDLLSHFGVMYDVASS